MKLTRQKDVCYPCYIATGKSGDTAWVEQPKGRRWGWCVYTINKHGDDTDKQHLLWLGSFREAKEYANELTDF